MKQHEQETLTFKLHDGSILQAPLAVFVAAIIENSHPAVKASIFAWVQQYMSQQKPHLYVPVQKNGA